MDQQETTLIDAVDMEVLMHRNAHFGSNFEVMLDYYKQLGVGVMPDFEWEQIKRLEELECERGQDLAELYLPDAAKKVVLEAQRLYQKLRDVYTAKEVATLPMLISDLILAEENVPEKEIEALVRFGEDAVPALVELLHTDSFYDPLFPGYGRSPIFVARVLAQIGDERAIIPLFEALGQDNFFTDEEITKALSAFGVKSRDFLIRRMQQQPFSKENEYAAIALNAFPEEEEIAHQSLVLLQQEEVFSRRSLVSYLIFNCEGLKSAEDRRTFQQILSQQTIAADLRREMSIVVKNWGVEKKEIDNK